MSQIFPETVALITQAQQEYLAEMKRLGKPIPMHTDWEDGLPDGKPTAASPFPTLAGSDKVTPEMLAKGPTKPRKEGVLKGTSKAEVARQIMRETKDSGKPLDTIIQMIMDATGHDKALAKATYKANAARVGIAL